MTASMNCCLFLAASPSVAHSMLHCSLQQRTPCFWLLTAAESRSNNRELPSTFSSCPCTTCGLTPCTACSIDEWQYVINGTLEVGVFTEPGQSATGILRSGDLGFAPHGSGHYLRNIGQQSAYVVLIFNQGLFTDVEVGNFLGTVPTSYVAASLNISDDAVKAFDLSLGGFAPGQRPS